MAGLPELSVSTPALVLRKVFVSKQRIVKDELLLYISNDLTDWSRLSRINTFIEEHSVASPTIFVFS